MAWLALAFCAGSAVVQFLPALPASSWLLLPAAAALALRARPLAAACLCGFAWTGWQASGLAADDWPCARDRETVEIEGTVSGPATPRHGRVDFDLRTAAETRARGVPSRLRLSWYGADRVPEPGQRWRVSARLRCRHGFANGGAPSRELDLLRQRIGATGYIQGDSTPRLLADTGAGPVVERLRVRIARAIATAAPGSASVAVLQGLAVGVRGGIPDSLWEAFAVTGVAHLMAISGLHVTAFALFALWLLGAGWRRLRLPSPPARIAIEMSLVISASAAYTALAGASLPALRTLAMVALVAAMRVLRRALPAHEVLAVAALMLLASDPLALTSAGFWLSFVATAALLAVADAGGGAGAVVRKFARSQLAVTALLAPVLVAVFGRLSLVAPLANAVAIPFFCLLLLPAVLCATLLTLAAPEIAAFAWRSLARGLDPFWPWLEAVARLPGASWAPAARPLAVPAIAGLIAFAALLVPGRGLAAAALTALVALGLGRAERPDPGGWRLDVLDVGQGLSAVVQTRGHVLLFDAGPRWRGGGAASRVTLLPHLRARGIRAVDLLVISHDDADHAGGADAALHALRVERVLAGPGRRHAAAAGICASGQRWRWDGVDFEVLHPGSAAAGGDNDRSCALAVRGAGGGALLLADPEAHAESELVRRELAADVVLLPHHGSRSSSSAALVSAVGARVGIASAGFGNRWRMPHEEVVARWRAGGATVLSTAEVGAVSVRFGVRPGAIEVATERGATRRWWRP